MHLVLMYMSMGMLMEEGQALIWRGAMIMKSNPTIIRDILWEELDILFIDMPQELVMHNWL